MGWEEWLISTIARALAYGTPLLLGTLGEVYAERSGVVNLGVEGMMAIGAFSAFAVAQSTGNPGLGILVAAVAGGGAALIHAFLTVTLRANQYVSGLALTMFGLGLSGLLGRGWEGVPLKHPLPAITVPYLADIPILGPMLFQNQSIITYLGLVLAVVLWVLLYRTRWGITLRSVGESPATADALGVNVYLVRYLAVILGGVLAGVAGGYLSVEYRPSWTEGMTGGMGWIVIALTIFVAWDPVQAIGGAVLFGALYHLSYRLQPWVAPELLKLMPYAAAIIVLAFVGLGGAQRRRGAPGALGVPYARGEK
ncbi:MAG: ABC transporter permease [Candidatus Bipolaricaulis sp.]|jgi:simple sugar transport system permease protein|nr:ABC transporter permease [Candidatus Bipolaricaulis sp.]